MIDARLKLELTMFPGTIFLGNGGVEKWVSTNGATQAIQNTTANKPALLPDGLVFDGTNDELTIADNSIFDLGLSTTPFTVNFWIITADTTWVIFGRHGGSDIWNSTTGHQYYFFYTSGTIFWSWWNGSAQANATFSMTLSDSLPHHIEIGYDGTTTRVYVDGIYKTATAGAYAKPSSASGFTIGHHIAGAHYFTGRLAHLAIYNTCLHTTTGSFPIPAYPTCSIPPSPPPTLAFVSTAITNLFDSGE